MKIHNIVNLLTFHADALEGTVCILGTFDGIHCGHSQLFRKAKQVAQQLNLKISVFTFPFKISNFLKNDFRLIYPHTQKYTIFQQYGVEHCFNMELTKNNLNLLFHQFLLILQQQLCAQFVVCGSDFRFGKKAKGGVSDLQDYYQAQAIILDVKNKKLFASSHIRHLLQNHNLHEANRLLVEPIQYQSAVVLGNRHGTEILGYPTTNQIVNQQLLLSYGVYASWVEYNHHHYYGMSCLWKKGGKVLLETNIFEFDEMIYHQTITVTIISYLRPLVPFQGWQHLKLLLHDDKKRTLNFFATKFKLPN